MAAGGWGYSSNPFSGGAANDDLEQPAPAPAAAAGSAYGAWGGAAPAPPAAAAPPPFAVQAAQTQKAPKKGFFGRGGDNSSASAAPTSFAAAVGATGASNGVLTSREAELARREAEVARREAALNQREATDSGSNEPNFPPCYPLIRHNIAADIPPWNRSMVRFALIVELIEIFGFLYNAIITLIAMLANTAKGLNWWFVALLATVIGIPASWWLWYKSLFGSARTDGTTYSYMKTFILIFLNIAWCAWMVIAIPGLGDFSAGVFPTIDLFNAGGSKNTAFGIMYIINICIWGIAALGSWVVLGSAVRAYRRGDDGRKSYEAAYGPYVARGASRT